MRESDEKNALRSSMNSALKFVYLMLMLSFVDSPSRLDWHQLVAHPFWQGELSDNQADSETDQIPSVRVDPGDTETSLEALTKTPANIKVCTRWLCVIWSREMSQILLMLIYRLITAYLLLRVNLDKIMHARWDFDASSATNPEGECIGQASKLKRKCIILSKFSSTK